jgi:hypothetical protein
VNVPFDGSGPPAKSPEGFGSKLVILLGGVAATLSIASCAATEQRAKASKARGLKIPEVEAFFCI